MLETIEPYLRADYVPAGPTIMLNQARRYREHGQLEWSATIFDRLWGLYPQHPFVESERRAVLDELSHESHGLLWRYVPAGPYVMGNNEGEYDERPAHWVELDGFYITEIPITWAQYCSIMDFSPPKNGGIPKHYFDKDGNLIRSTNFSHERFTLHEQNKIRGRYSAEERYRFEDDTPSIEHQGPVPLVGVSWEQAHASGVKITTDNETIRLPTEAEWEKAARGGLIGANYPWGDSAPSPLVADYDRFETFVIQNPRHYPPNHYGLYAMAGTVWEWTADYYDALYYSSGLLKNPRGPEQSDTAERVIRGGSWADCAEVLRVSFRASHPSVNSGWGTLSCCPNIGYRLVKQKH